MEVQNPPLYLLYRDQLEYCCTALRRSSAGGTVEDGWAVDGRQKKVLEPTGRVANVALSVRDRSRKSGSFYSSAHRHRYCDTAPGLRFGAVLILLSLSDVP